MFYRAIAALVGVVTLTGCAAGRLRHERRGGDGTVALEAFIEKVRQLSVEARPARPDTPTIERTDPALAAARTLLAAAPTAEHHRLVAESYVRVGVRDSAFDHFTAALKLNRHDAAALDGRARIWRDWGFPDRALGDVYRAISAAPDLAAPRNTLGMLLVAIGQPAAARRAFDRALTLEPGAAHILNNLCYAALLEGDSARAVSQCRAAVAADPHLTPARNNLALAYAAAGDLAAASREFLITGDAAAERFNMGVAFTATGRYREAAAAFDEAAALRPSLNLARQRAQQARDHAGTAPLPQ